MAKRLLIILPIVYLFYALLTLDTRVHADRPVFEKSAALLTDVRAAMDADLDAEQVTVTAAPTDWAALLGYPDAMEIRLKSARLSRDLQFWGGIFFAAAVFAIGITQRAWTGKAPPR